MSKRIVAPSHIALIPDGNRRWAEVHRWGILQAYGAGVNRFLDFAKWSREFGVKTISVWALSTENLKNRTETELKILFALYMRAAKNKKLINDLKANRVRLNVVGDTSSLPKKLRDALHKVEDQTKMYTDYTINLLINYGGKEDLVYSLQRLFKESKNGKTKIDEKAISEHLRSATVPDVDLIVRTSGEMRLSGLLPWQGSYSELYFAKKYWPDFDKNDFKKAIDTFSRRQRRFGK
jgi:tritrans,polycis-undecaprenyl-diphosphate synthase [geranylgeranyl-diphosphate specific]